VGVGGSLGPFLQSASPALEDAAYDPEVQAFDRHREREEESALLAISFGQSAVAGALTG
jgi:hypothetical protein